MRLKVLIELPDTPGQLVNILQPLSSLGANVSTIIHDHDKRTADGKVPVRFTLDGSRDALRKGMEIIREMDLTIIEIDGVLQKHKQTLLLKGDITTDNLTETVNKINELNEVKVISVNLSMGPQLDESVCKMIIETRSNKGNEAIRQIKEISKENNLLLIKEI